MDAIEFDGQTVIIAKDQPEYTPLPANVCMVDGLFTVTFCWQPTPEELAEIVKTGVIWHSVATFGQPLQPQRLMSEKPPWCVAEPAHAIMLPTIPLNPGGN